MAGRGADNHPRGADATGDHGRIRLHRQPDGEVEFLAYEIGRALGFHQRHADPGMSGEEARQRRHHVEVGEVREHADAQMARRLGGAGGDLVEARSGLVDRAPHPGVERTSGLGRAHPAGGAVEEPRPEPVLERAHALADPAPRQAARLRGPGEAAGLADRREDLQIVKETHGSIVRSSRTPCPVLSVFSDQRFRAMQRPRPAMGSARQQRRTTMLDATRDFSAAAVCPTGGGIANMAFGTKTIRITAAQTGGRTSVFEAVIGPGEGPPLHMHHNEDETFHVLEGRLRIWCGDETFEAGAGATAVLPRGVPHRFRNETDAPARALVQCAPGGFEGFFVEVADLAAPEPASIAAVARRYGLEFLA